jgi:hypothetical protein
MRDRCLHQISEKCPELRNCRARKHESTKTRKHERTKAVNSALSVTPATAGVHWIPAFARMT